MKLIPKQFKLSTKVGGFLIIFNEVMALFSIANFIMISRINYFNSDDSFIREIFPSYYYFMMAMAVCSFAFMIFVYSIVIPSKNKFAQEQAYKDDRSPLYNKVLELEDQLKDIKELLENEK